MQDASPEDAGLEAQGRRGEAPYGSGGRGSSRLAGLERERAAMEMFARVAAHELMAPLIASETRARLLEDQLHDHDVGRAGANLQDLIRGLSRMRQLVDTLLRDARSCGMPLERKPVNLQQLVTDAVESLDAEIRAYQVRVLAAELPVVEGDGALLGVVFNNLLLNALRYGPRNGGDVRIHARREAAQWRISVASQGDTIQAEDRARIFEPYSRGTHERRVAGAGLGLAICRSIVERHGGIIDVAPVRAGGNRFYFTIPDTRRAIELAPQTPTG